MAGRASERQRSCGVRMSEGKDCHRPIHSAPEHDPTPVCLMHSIDPSKSDREFQAEFERILSHAERSGGTADFSEFQFSFSDYAGRTFPVVCDFSNARFVHEANFFAVSFMHKVDLSGATFEQVANFHQVTFMQEADFTAVTFTGEAVFQNATFTLEVIFYGATFEQRADFYEITFTENAGLNGTTFLKEAIFSKGTFTKEAGFGHASFVQEAIFGEATFTREADFTWSTFATNANFTDTNFLDWVGFEGAVFLESASFRGTHFRNQLAMKLGLQFTNAKLEHPERIEFYQTDLSQALFYNTDVSKVDFTQVRWRERRNRFSLFEEVVPLEDAGNLVPLSNSPDERNYGLIAKTYQQLKRNYDGKGDYWTAGHFHYGEMEMLRLHSGFRLRPLRWLAQNLSLTALYRYGSAYGESVKRPLAWLAAIVLMFALLFPLAGLAVNPNQGEMGLTGWQVDYWNAGQFFQQHQSENPVPRWVRWMTWDNAAVPLLVHSEMTALSVAGFQKELRYSPAYPWGRALALLELLLTTTLGGLFLLAIRRQYKRS